MTFFPGMKPVRRIMIIPGHRYDGNVFNLLLTSAGVSSLVVAFDNKSDIILQKKKHVDKKPIPIIELRIMPTVPIANWNTY